MDGNKILHPVDIDKLIAQGLLTPLVRELGFRRIHRHRLNHADDDDYMKLPVLAPHNVFEDLPGSNDDFIMVPDEFISMSTIVFIGFKPTRAKYLWKLWCQEWGQEAESWKNASPHQAQARFIGYILSYFNTGPDATTTDIADGTQILDHYGVSTELKHYLLSPERHTLRSQMSCCFWAADMMGTRYSGLQSVKSASNLRAEILLQTQEGNNQQQEIQQQGRQS